MLNKAFLAAQTAAANNGFFARYNGKEFMEAIAAGCALIAAADGEVEEKEKKKFGRYLDVSPVLKHFDKRKIHSKFNEFCDGLEFSDVEAWKEVHQTPADQRQTVFNVMVAVAGSDGEIEPAEEKILRKLANDWGIDTSSVFQ